MHTYVYIEDLWRHYMPEIKRTELGIITKGFEGFEIVLLPCGNQFHALLGKSHSCKALSWSGF